MKDHVFGGSDVAAAVSAAAQALGISRRTIYRRLKEYGVV